MTAFALSSPQANAQGCSFPVTVGTESALNDAIACYNAATSGNNEVNLTASVTLSGSSTQINNTAGASLTIKGNGNAIDGAGTYRMFHIAAGNLTIDNLIMQNGKAETNPCNNHFCGGALLIDAAAVVAVANSTFFNNQATNGGGGAILNSGTLTVDRSLFRANTTRYGGGIYNFQTGASMIVNSSTFSANDAGGNLGTGGAVFQDSGTTTLNYVTVHANSAGRFGAGIYANDGTVSLNDSIVAGNTDSHGGDTSAKDCAVTSNRGVISAAGSLDGDGSCGAATPSAQVNLGPLRDNGGPTLTHAPVAGSIAVQAADGARCGVSGPNGAGGVDQRGTSRPQGPTCDIGAFEVVGAPWILTTGFSIEENTAGVDVNAADDTDSEGSGLTYRASGGADQALFTIDSATGVLAFVSQPDFELPHDANQDNVYEIQITVTDSGGLTDVKPIAVTVTDLLGCPAFPMSAMNWSELNYALRCYSETPAGNYTINIGQIITLTNPLRDVLNPNATLTINGGGFVLDGASTHRILNIQNGSVTIDSAMLQKGKAVGSGGAIYVAGGASLTLTNSTVADSSAGKGGGIANDGTLNVVNGVFYGNSSASGGAIRNNGMLQLHNSTLRNNSTTLSSEGGGLSNYGTAQVTGSTAYANSANYGAAFYSRGGLTVVNTTLSGNNAAILAGGIYIFRSGNVTVYNSTLAGNGASTGGTILNNGGSFAMYNTIVAHSTRGGNCWGEMGGNNNLVDDGTCGSHGQSSSINLGPLQANGGTTLTRAIGTNSAALDTGDNTICAATPVSNVDQRGDTRPSNGTCDIGAFEQTDIDADTITNDLDNCPTVANPGQENLDNDSFGDACDDDVDGDAILNPADTDDDNDGLSDDAEAAAGTNAFDPDSDDDHIVDSLDRSPLSATNNLCLNMGTDVEFRMDVQGQFTCAATGSITVAPGARVVAPGGDLLLIAPRVNVQSLSQFRVENNGLFRVVNQDPLASIP